MPDTPQTAESEQTVFANPTAKLLLLGNFALVLSDGRPIHIPTKKNRALLAILALSPGRRVTREKLCGLLWSDRADDQARSSLRQSLATLRKELGGTEDLVIRTQDDQVVLQPIFTDTDAVAACARSTELHSLRVAAELFRGELLSDTVIQDDAFEHWLTAERRKYADIGTAILAKIVANESGQERVTYAKQLVALDPFNESAHRQLMTAYADVGERALALSQYEACCKVLREEFGVEPSNETAALRQGIADRSRVVQPPAATMQILDQRSLAVLPFCTLDGQSSYDYLADGIAEDIITGLARFTQLSVVSRNLSFRHRGDVDVVSIAKELNVAYIVEGSLRRSANQLRITVQLISGQTGKHVWADAYDVGGVELFEAQDKVVHKIVATLVGRMTGAGARHARLKPPSSLAAYELALRANAMDWQSRESMAEARQMLERALTIDPDYATAHSLLAAVSLREAAYFARLTRNVLDTCLLHARRAVEINEDDSSCHSILGWVLIARGEFDLASEHLAHAELLNPLNPFVMVNRGSLLAQTGYPDQAIALLKQVQALDPYFNPSWVREKLGFAHFLAGRYDECVDHLSRTPKIRFHMLAIKGSAYAMLGKFELAADCRDKVLKIRPDCTAEVVLSLLPCARQSDKKRLVETLVKSGLAAGVIDEL